MAKATEKIKETSNDYLFSMSHAPKIDEGSSLLQMIPIIVFSSFVILIVRMYTYTRPMSQFFWTNQTDTSQIVDFFSYYKMVFILICAVTALLVLLFKVTTQTLAIKKSLLYIPMAVYSLFVALSYIFSDYKEFAWFGYNDRFEGTLPLLAYMVLLFFIINSVNSEKNIKMILYPLIGSSVLLSILGISQATDHDFFQTTIGQKLIMPNLTMESGLTTWQEIDAAAAQGAKYLNFTFLNKEIYQTVYNINYVSFYLTLLIPLFGMLFILSMNKGSEEKLWKKIGWGILFALTIYNLIGSASSGGFLGLGVVGIMGLIILNKKLIKWIKPLTILFVITGIVMGITVDRWLPEIKGASSGVLGGSVTIEEEIPTGEPASIKPFIDYIETGADTIIISINENPLLIQITKDGAGAVDGLILLDESQSPIAMNFVDGQEGVYSISDERFYDYLKLSYAQDGNHYFILLDTFDVQLVFQIEEEEIYYRNQLGRKVSLYDVEHFGFKNNPHFGSQRGFIWSRSFPLLKHNILLGTGADTYCVVFPQEDYAGKYSNNFQGVLNTVIDKPHNMYLHVGIGTGGISLLALLALYGIYLVQSVKLYRKSKFEDDYLTFVGAGIFFGIAGFLVTGLVDDSTVSVMPMFYTLLGMGIAVNMILERRNPEIKN